MSKDYYEILGVGKNASQDEIKRAYRKLAHEHHPDKKGGDEKKFKEINEAYQILGDEQKRQQYDRFGKTFAGGGQSGFSGFEGFDFSNFGGGFNADLGDIFEDFLGGRRSVVIEKTSKCEICGGNGAEPGTNLKKCATCQGTGTVREMRRSLFGAFTALSECSHCRGRGESPERACKHCRGAGILRKSQGVEIMIPPGIRDGEAIKLTGLGEEVQRGQAGDLYVRIHVLPHHIFRREGYDILMDLHLPLSKMLLGGEEMIETLEGKISVRIPELSKVGDFLRLRGKGVPRGRGRGDLLIRLFPKLPKKLTPRAKEIL